MLGSEFRPFCAVHPASRESVGAALTGLTGNQGLGTVGTSAWPTVNLAIYIPFSLAVASRVRQLGLINGSVASGNFDVGIYSGGGERLLSTGSTAQSGTSVLQLVNTTDLNLPAGDYYLGLAMDGTTGTAGRLTSQTAPILAAAGILQEASAFPLPASMTGVTPTNAYLPYPFAVFGRIL